MRKGGLAYHQDVETANDKTQEPGGLLKLHHVFAEDGARDPALYDAKNPKSVRRGDDGHIVEIELSETLVGYHEFRREENEDDDDCAAIRQG